MTPLFTLPELYQPYFVFGLIGFAALAMLTNRIRYDFIAVLIIGALTLSGIMTVQQALAGFGNSVVVLIAGLLVIGDMLERTGVASVVGEKIQQAGQRSHHMLLIILMLASALLSAIMSSTAVVAIFIPIVLGMAKRLNTSAATLLLPMSYAALVSGMLTLIATPPNLVISARLAEAGYAPLNFFSFTAPGIIILLLVIVFVTLFASRLLPDNPPQTQSESYHRKLSQLLDDYRSERDTIDVVITQHSPLNGVTVADSHLYMEFGIRILGVARQHRGDSVYHTAPQADLQLYSGDILHITGTPKQLQQAQAQFSLPRVTLSELQHHQQNWELGATAVLIHPNSRLIGKTIKEARFRDRYNLDVLGLKRNQQTLSAVEDVPLSSADSLLVTGAWSQIKALQHQNHDFVLLELPAEADEVAPAYKRMPLALTIICAMVLLSVFNVMPLVIAVLLLVLVAVTGRCITAAEAYRAIHWQTIVLIAGMLPLATALDSTGGTALIVDSLLSVAGSGDPQMLLVLLFAITVVLTNFLSNTASAVLMAPIAVSTAELVGVSPYPLAITVLFAASAAFLTPVASPIVTLVVEPGRYRFIDFLKLGTPLLLIVFAVTYWAVPWFFPWHP